VQTGKVRNFPVVLYGSEYWSGLVDWLRKRLQTHGYIGPDDLSIFSITDDIEEVIRLLREGIGELLLHPQNRD